MGSFRNSLLTGILSLFNIPYITPQLRKLEKPILIHISDTPGFIYPFIFRLVKKLEPEALIHTGDMIDDIKLEFRPGQLNEYSAKIRKILNKIEKLPVKEIYLVPGNHDNRETIDEFSRRSIILPEMSRIQLKNISFCFSHQYSDQAVDADFYLFGDNLPEIEKKYEDTVLLNGIPFINIISLKNRKIIKIKYPPGTESARLMTPKIGL